MDSKKEIIKLKNIERDLQDIQLTLEACLDTLIKKYPEPSHKALISSLLMNGGLNLSTQALGLHNTYALLQTAATSLKQNLEQIYGETPYPPPLN